MTSMTPPPARAGSGRVDAGACTAERGHDLGFSARHEVPGVDGEVLELRAKRPATAPGQAHRKEPS